VRIINGKKRDEVVVDSFKCKIFYGLKVATFCHSKDETVKEQKPGFSIHRKNGPTLVQSTPQSSIDFLQINQEFFLFIWADTMSEVGFNDGQVKKFNSCALCIMPCSWCSQLSKICTSSYV